MSGVMSLSAGSMSSESVHGLFPFCAGRMVTAGAARFGRRTPGPHVWPAAPLQFMCGDGWRGAAMGKSTSSNPEWFSQLAPVDRTIARRLIELHGEGAFLRVARAAAKGQGKRGRPAEQWSDKWLSEGYRRWLLSPNASFEKIAREVINADDSVDPRSKNGRIRALRDRLAREIKDFLQRIETETHAECDARIRNPDIFTSVENSLFAERVKILRPGLTQKRQILFFNAVEPSERLRALFSKHPSLQREQCMSQSSKLVAAFEKRRFLIKQSNAQFEKEEHFFLAFNPPLTGDLPCTFLTRLYWTVSQFVEEEMRLFKQGPKKP